MHRFGFKSQLKVLFSQPIIDYFRFMFVRPLFTYFTLIIIAFSCKKDACENYSPHKEVEIHPSLDSYKFKESSYWVYKNDATSELDSHRVIYSSNNDFTGEYPSKCSGGTFVYEYRMTVHSFLNNSDYDYFMIGSGLYKDTNSKGNHHGRFIFSGTNFYSPDSGAENIENIPLINLNGNDFHNVKKIWIKVLASNSYYPNLSYNDLYFYFSDSVGLIKWEVSEGSFIVESWSIKSWDVIF
jgi:hypothetical protein